MVVVSSEFLTELNDMHEIFTTYLILNSQHFNLEYEETNNLALNYILIGSF